MSLKLAMVPVPPVPRGPAISARRSRYNSGRIHPPETAPQGGGGSRKQHAEVAQPLELTVHRDARQRGQVIAMLREQDAGPRGDAGEEAEPGRDPELARAGGARIAHRIREVM